MTNISVKTLKVITIRVYDRKKHGNKLNGKKWITADNI